jgi:predicted nucleic acid-binding protein
VAPKPLILVDHSALARLHLESVRAVLSPMLARGQLATCAVVDLEVLFSARSPDDYVNVRQGRRRCRDLPMTPRVCSRALEVQSELARRSQHRGTGFADLLIAACAEIHGTGLLHYDADFDLIASVTGQPARWVVPRGSVP